MKRKHLLLLPVFFLLLAQSVHARQAIIVSFTGTVEVQPKNSKFWKKAAPKLFIKEGEKIRTGSRSKANLLFQDGSRTEVGPGTILEMSHLAAPIQMKQTAGSTRNKVSRLGKNFTLRTPTAVCSVRGTDFYVGIDKAGDTKLDVYSGIVNGLKNATGESTDVGAGQSLKFDASQETLGTPAILDGNSESGDTSLKELARKEVGLDMTRDQIQAAAAEEMKLAEYQEGKSLVDVNGFRVRLEEYILRRPKDVAEADRDKAFKFVVLNTRENRFDYFTYKGVFNKTLPADLSVALRNAAGRQIGDAAPEYYLSSYEMAQSNLTDALKDMADGGHLVKVTYDGTTYTLQAYNVNSDGTPGSITDTANQLSSANGKIYDPVADVYKNAGVSQDGVYDSANDTFKTLKQGETLWRTVFNRYAHLMGPSSVLSNLSLSNVPSGTLTQPWFQYYSARAGVTNIATLESINNADLTQGASMIVRGKTLTVYVDQNIGNAGFKYLNGNYAFDSYFPDSANQDSPLFSDGIHQRLITYYPRTNIDIPFEQYDTYILSNEGKIAPISAFSNATSGRTFKEELIKWNYEQITRSSAFESRTIDLVVEPKILIKSGLIK